MWEGTESMVRYEVVGERLYSPDHGWYTGYGIRAYRRVEDAWEPVVTVSDLSTDRQAVEALAHRCTAGELSPIHLRDVVEDWLL